MIGKLSLASLWIMTLLLVACGTVATPIPPTSTPTATATVTPSPIPTETPVPPSTTPTPRPTNTPVPPTATPEPPTATQTQHPTHAPHGDHTSMQSTGVSSTDETAVNEGDPANGEVLFNTTFETELGPFACATCHLLDTTAQLVGPGLLDASSHAGHHVPGQSAEEYLRNSILTPDAFVVEGFSDQLMPETYSEIFTEEQLNDLVAFLLTL